MLFDDPFYLEINNARWAMAEPVLSVILSEIQTCIDVGCGPGWFSDKLNKLGLDVFGVDGRKEVVHEAARRVPRARFAVCDITASKLELTLSSVDLVFCFGLLYHLENPFAAIRNLCALSNKYLFIETQVAPGDGNDLVLVSEGKNETQGLNFHAVIPSRRALLKMLYVAGYKSVYRYVGEINHIDFVDSSGRRHRREVFLAVKSIGSALPNFVQETEPVTPKIDYNI